VTDFVHAPGPSVEGLRVPAVWWRRLLAELLDNLILLIPLNVLSLIVDPKLRNVSLSNVLQQANAGINTRVISLVAIAWLSYFTYLDGAAKGQTIGKRALGITVRDIRPRSATVPDGVSVWDRATRTNEAYVTSPGRPSWQVRGVPVAVTGSIGFGRALLRRVSILAFLWLIPLLAVFDGLWSFRDPKNQTWHDKLAGSVVVDAV
jgi:uncharacterized RDD family membrane protein YckC